MHSEKKIWLFIVMIARGIAGPSYNQPRFSPTAKWNPNATTFANVSVISRLPFGLFVDIHNTIYVLGKSNNRIFVWREGNMTLSRNLSGNLAVPFSIFVTLNGNIYVDNGRNHDRVDMWTPNSTSSTTAMNVTGECHGLFLDLHDDLYCCVNPDPQVIKGFFNTSFKMKTIVAGNGINGSTSALLRNPQGIFVDNELNLYVADCGNDRIQRFAFGQLNATTIAGQGAPGTITLRCPTGIILDGDGYLFITDYSNNRIIRSGPTGFQCIAGCSGVNGPAADQLHYPRGLSFDSYGNIFVADGYNHRIQKFLLANNSFETATTTNIQSSATTISTQIGPHGTGVFIPSVCPNASFIGQNCDILNKPCDIVKPCQNNGTCYNNDIVTNGYVCLCLTGFDGTRCELDHRPCKPDTCWNNGVCYETSDKTFSCSCKSGWEGTRCENQINYCMNVTCQNKAVCRPLFLNYTCECSSDGYSGRHCEMTSTRMVIRQMVCKSFGYIAILALVIVVMFIVIMDILKYCFGIDPVREERERLQRSKRRIAKHKPVIERAVYVNAPSEQAALEETEN